MTSFSGEFVVAHGALGEQWSGLEGPGTIEVGADGLVLDARSRRRALARAFATVVATVATLAAVVLVVFLPGLHAVIDIDDVRLVGVLGFGILAASWLATESLLLRVLPRARVRRSIAWCYVPTIRIRGERLEVITSAHDLSGLSGFVTDRPAALVEACRAARSTLPGYR